MNRQRSRSRWAEILGHDTETSGHVGPKYPRYKGAINEVLRRGYEAMLNTVGALNDFDNILVCGGGGAVFFEFLREHAPELRRRLKMDGGSTFSNVRGFQVVADYAANEASANR